MNIVLEKDICFLCGCDARSGNYNKGNGKAFIECTNESCGEYLITNATISALVTNDEKKREFSKIATSRESIQNKDQIFVISYHGGVQASFRALEDVLTEKEISFFGFRREDK